MATATPDKFYSTYARLFLSWSDAIRPLIKQHSRQGTVKSTGSGLFEILPESQVSQSLYHPQNQILKTMIATAYSDSIKAEKAILEGQELIDEHGAMIYIEEALNKLEEKKRTSSPATKASIEHTVNALNQQYKLLRNIKNAEEHSRRQLQDIRSNFVDITTRHNQEWTAYREQRLADLKTEIDKLLTAAGLPALPQGEIDNLLRQDLQEVLDRFTDLGARKDLSEAELERLLKMSKPQFDTYFRMKAFMAFRSVDPSREKTGPLMKKLDKFFTRTKEDGEQLTAKQAEEIRKVNTERVQPLIKVADSNLKTLTKLEDDRQELLHAAATVKDLKAIKENADRRIAQERYVIPTP